ncbi:hypothetical protein [Cloacibacterium sp.]
MDRFEAVGLQLRAKENLKPEEQNEVKLLLSNSFKGYILYNRC